MGKVTNPEVKYLAALLVQKVWQGDVARQGLATQCASVCIAGMQDYAWDLSEEREEKNE